MNKVTAKTICKRCGEEVYQRAINIETFNKLDTSSKEAYIKCFMDFEGVTKEVATSWAEHGMYEQCQEKNRNCPVCNHQLKTWKAKMCLSCGAGFEPWYSHENNTQSELA